MDQTQQLAKRIMTLSREQIQLLAVRLKQQGIDLDETLILPQRRDGNVVPASYAQRRLWFLDQYEPDSPLYNIPLGLRLRGPLDVPTLELALNQVVGRHEALRTTFAEQDGSPVQIIASQVHVPIRVEDLQHLSADEKAIEVARYADEESQRPFDLMHGPLLRVQVLRLASDEHVMLLTIHHIVADGWSVQILVREMVQAYAALAAGHPISLPPLPIQYADFSQWQQRHLQGDRLAEQLDYWREQLGGHLPVLELPTDYPRPSRPSHRGATRTTRLSADLTRDLHALSRQENGTLFTTLLSAFAVLLHRCTGQTGFCIGTPIANRNRAEIEGLIGFFVNTLAMRANLEGNPSFRDVLRRMRKVALDAYDHQDLPFEMVVDAAQPERMESHSPLFQVMFVLQNTPSTNMRLPSLSAEQMPTPSHVSRFDLTLNISESEAGLDTVLEYSADLFEAATADRLLRHLGTLLESIVGDPDRAISDLAIMDDSEVRQILVEWNATAAPFPDQITVHRLFEEQAQATPDVPAVVIDGEISYGELNARANRLARRLVRLEVGPDHPVGVCIERSIDMVTAVLAVLKAGGAYLPLDPTYPAQRLAFMLADSSAQVLLTQAHLRDLLPTEGVHTLCVDAERAGMEQEDASNLPSTTTPDNLAYVIYTSGSTGQPKGVMIPHRGVLNLLTGLEQSVYQRHPSSGPLRASLNAPLSFDASVQQLVLLLRGDTLYVLPDEIRADGEGLVRYIREHRLDVLDCVPTQLKLLLAAGLLDGTGWAPSIILPGGEAIDAATWQALAEASGTAFYNMYGPTECTVDATTCRVDDHPEGPVIGWPLANRACYVLDEHKQPAPIGVPGELYIGGEGLARGYLNQPELTAERFMADPFSTGPGARMYKTGDLVRYLADEQIEFLGRVDHQVKVRGHRIELGEIESLLRGHPDVAEATVIVREDVVGDQRLVAYVVCAEGRECQPTALRRHLEAQLPDYMVPGSYVQLEAMPLTPNGKIDRQALPAPGEMERTVTTTYTPPRSPVEEMLCELWAQVLGIGQVGIHDDFFELGGHSLLATQLVSRIRKTLNMELPLRELFQYRTIAELGERIADLHDVMGSTRPPIAKRSGDGPPPLSYGQQRLWFLDQLEPESALYNIPLALRLRGELDEVALIASLHEIVRRHEVLRSAYPTVNGVAQQVIVPVDDLSIAETDLSMLSPKERETAISTQIRADARQPFDLATGPLLRARLIRLGEDEHVLAVIMHHIVSDGWSMGIVMRELHALYQAHLQKKSLSMEPLRIQYGDYAAWQREWLQGEVLDEQMAYWREQLKEQPPLLDLPTDHPRSPLQSNRGGGYRFALPTDLTIALQDLSRQEGATLFMTLLAAWQALLSRYSGETDISVGTPVANRNHADTENLIGFFVNTLVMRADLSGAPTFRELLGRVRQVALGAYAHQDVPFEMLVDALQPQRDMTRTPLFQVMFNWHNAAVDKLDLAELSIEPIDMEPELAMFDLTLVMAATEKGLVGGIEYNADLFEPDSVVAIAEHLQILLGAVIDNPDQAITHLPILTSAERDCLHRWNETDTPIEVECLHKRFEAQAAQTPDATAVIMPRVSNDLTQTLTYSQLDRRANQLAHYLIEQGVHPGDIVGMCVERCLDMPMVLLAILKAGGAYLPLDPAYPTERLQFMLKDSGARMVITQRHLMDRFPEQTTLFVDATQTWLKASDQSPTVDITPDDLAYVIYTSGSTGRPKGAMVTHCNVINHNLAVQRLFDLNANDRVLQFCTISFDAAVEEIFPTWFSGATLVLYPYQQASSADELLGLVDREQITMLDLPTAYWHEIAYGLSLSQRALPTSLRLVVVGGDKADAHRLALWRQKAGTRVRWINTYGPTEATVIATAYEPDDDLTKPLPDPIPIGRPIDNVQIHILDSHMQPVPVGLPGELFIGGMGVTKGYLNLPSLTDERFVQGLNGAGRLYRTGDRARYLPDGNIGFLGRFDNQIKIRGFRVELGEIEARLSEHPVVREAAVVAPSDPSGMRRLAAYVVPINNADLANSWQTALSDYLKTRLPSYMVPSAFVAMDTLPQTPSGKIDTASLPAPSWELGGVHVAPRTEEERVLAEIWAEVLQVEQIGVHDNVFELGADSIQTVQVVARARQAGLSLNTREIFAHQTIAELASVANSTALVETEQGPVVGSVPLTPIQHWFFQQDVPKRGHWNQAVLLQIQEPLAPDWLQQACEHLIAHHDALRHRFERTDEGWRQVAVEAQTMSSFDRVDLSSVADDELPAAIEAEANRWQRSLDLTNGPLFRLVYIDLGDDRPGRLLAVAHHLVMDGVSWRIVLEDLQRIYDQLARGQTVDLPHKTTSYKRWAETLARSVDDDRDELAFWLAQHKGAAPLPRDMHHGENTVASACTVHVSLDANETDTLLTETLAAYRAEIDALLLAALAHTVAHWSPASRIVVEMEGHGRGEIALDIDVSRTVGWFTALYPLAVPVSPDGDLVGTLRLVKEQLRQVPRDGIGYGCLRYLDPHASAQLDALPQPEISFNYLGRFDQTLKGDLFRLARESTGLSFDPQSKRSTIIDINGGIADGQLTLAWTYSVHIHRADTIDRLAHTFMDALRTLIRQSQAPQPAALTPSDFPLAGLRQRELDKVLSRTNTPMRGR